MLTGVVVIGLGAAMLAGVWFLRAPNQINNALPQTNTTAPRTVPPSPQQQQINQQPPAPSQPKQATPPAPRPQPAVVAPPPLDRALTAGEESRLRPKDEFQECALCPRMVVVPAGRFNMGSAPDEKDRSSDEGPVREVTIARPFAVGKFELTFAEWDACVADGGCQGNKTPGDQGWGRDRRPVINVSWNDAKEYVAWLSKKTGKGYRLLTEAEWEYAARAGTRTRYSFGDEFSNTQANNDKGRTVPVGQYPANAFGLFDMHGNAWEWVEDCWVDNYNGAPNDGSARTTGDCSRRVLRGGSWDYFPGLLRSAFRFRYTTGDRSDFLGFRLGRTLTP